MERLHSCLKDLLRAGAAAATWTDDIPWVLLGLRSQPREDSDLSPAEAVYGVPLVLPTEFLQVEEFSGDQISNTFSKIIDTPAFSLPSKHNSGQQRPEELPADLLRASLIWVHHRGVVLPLQRPCDSPYQVLRCGTMLLHHLDRELGGACLHSTLCLMPCTDDTAKPGTPRPQG